MFILGNILSLKQVRERVWMSLVLCFFFWTQILARCWRLAILFKKKKKNVMLISLPSTWISAGIPMSTLCCDRVQTLLKGLSTTLKTGKPLKPSKNMPHVNSPKCLQMSSPELLSPVPPPGPEIVFGKTVWKTFCDFNMLNTNISLAQATQLFIFFTFSTIGLAYQRVFVHINISWPQGPVSLIPPVF